MNSQSHSQSQTSSSTAEQAQPRKLALKKETLRQLTNQELRVVVGGTSTTISLDPTQTQFP